MVQPTDKPGVVETYYHFVVELVIPVFMAIEKLQQQHQLDKSQTLLLLVGKRSSRSDRFSVGDVNQIFREWEWIFLAPAQVIILEMLQSPLCARKAQMGSSSRCSALAPTHMRSPRDECIRSLLRVAHTGLRALHLPIHASQRSQVGSVLFIPREQWVERRTRKIWNWAETVLAISNETMRSGMVLKVLPFDGLPLKQQLTALLDADIIITQRGSVNANFLVLHPQTRVLLLADPLDYDPFHWIGPLWYRTTVVHIKGGNFEPFGTVDVQGMQSTLKLMITETIAARNDSELWHPVRVGGLTV